MTTTTPSFSPVSILGVAFVNFTPHPITYIDPDAQSHTILPSGRVARIATISSVAFRYFGGLFSESHPGAPEGIEGFDEWAAAHTASTGQPVMGIVSSMFLDGLAASHDPALESTECLLCAPLTDNSAVRNEQGHIVAVRSFRLTAFAAEQIRAEGVWGVDG